MTMLTNHRQRRQSSPDEGGFTLLEILVAVVIISLIMGTIAAAFISSYKTTQGVSKSNQNASDIQLLSAFFPADVATLAGPVYVNNVKVINDGFQTTSANGGRFPFGACGSGKVGDVGLYSFNSNWDATTHKYFRTITYVATGSGLSSQLVRRECNIVNNAVVMDTAIVAQNFGSKTNPQAAAAVVGINCARTTCTLTVNGKTGTVGTYDYVLTAERRRPGELSATGVPCPPAAPTVSPGYTQNDVRWEVPVCDGGAAIDSYDVRQTPGGIATFSATTFQHIFGGLTNGNSYSYAVRAHNSVGYSPWSAESSPGVPAFSVPGAPTITSSTPGNKRLTITWVPPSNDGGKPITGYIIRATDQSGTTVSASIPGAVTTGKILGLQNGSPIVDSIDGAYIVTVAAINQLGEGPPSAAYGPFVSTKPLAGVPGPPTAVLAFMDPTDPTSPNPPKNKGRVRVTWVAPDDDGGTAITGYKVTSSLANFTTQNVTGNVQGADVINNSPAYPTGLPTTGSPITFFVQACNDSGCGDPSAGANVTPLWRPEKVAPAPTLRSTGIPGQGELSWTAPSANGSAITNYRIYLKCKTPTVAACRVGGVSTGASRDGEILDTPTASTTYTLTNQPQNTVVSYCVVAKNALGFASASPITVNLPAFPDPLAQCSAYSGEEILSGIPSPPTGLVASATGIQGQVSLSYTAPVNTGGRPITDYRIDVYQAATAAGPFTTIFGSSPYTTAGGPNTTTLINGLPVGFFYQFKAKTFNGVDESARSAASNTVGLIAVPNPPTNVVATDPGFASGGFAQIDFTPATQPAGTPAVTGYVITCVGCPQARSYTVGTGSSFQIGAVSGNSALPNGVAISFTVHAVNSAGAGAESAPSNTITLSGTPGAPINVTAVSNGAPGQIVVSWAPPASDGGKPITGYVVEQCVGTTTVNPKCPLAADTNTPVGNVTTFLVTGLTNGSSYTFYVKAVNANGTSPRSLFATAIPSTNATAPVIGTATATGNPGEAIVRWSAPASNGGNAITGYKITASTGQTFNVSGVGTLQATVTGLTDGTPTTFTVQAVNVNGPGAASAPSNTITTGKTPGAATNLVAAATNVAGQVNLTWTAAPANGPALTQNVITIHCTCAQDGTTQTVGGANTSFQMTGLEDGKAFTFTIVATNAFGNGPVSDPSNAATPIGVPSAPTNVVASVTGSSGTVLLTWDAPATISGSPVTSYTVYASTGQVLPTVIGTTTTFSGLDNGVPVSFRVQAVNDAGPSALSDPSNVVSPRGVPDAPTNVVAASTGIGGRVSLTWTAPNDNGAAITGYVITDSNGVITNVGPGTSTFIDGLPEGTPVTFVVAGVNAAGQGNDSAPSNAVTASGIPDAPTNVVATVTGPATVQLTFTAPNDHGAAITGYTVTISCSGGTCTRNGQSQAITSGGTIASLGEGGTASFTVTATNSAGTSGVGTSNTVNIPRRPDVPTGVTAVTTGVKGQVTVSWVTPASDGGLPITSYDVFSNQTSVTYNVPFPANSFTLPRAALPDNTSVTFKVRATNAVNSSAYSANSAPVTTPTLPGAPVTGSITVTSTGTSGQVDVSWAAPASNGGSPIVQYAVTILATGGAKNNTVENTVSGLPAALTLRISGLTVGKSYTFRVAAINDVGTGGRSGASAPPFVMV